MFFFPKVVASNRRGGMGLLLSQAARQRLPTTRGAAIFPPVVTGHDGSAHRRGRRRTWELDRAGRRRSPPTRRANPVFVARPDQRSHSFRFNPKQAGGAIPGILKMPADVQPNDLVGAAKSDNPGLGWFRSAHSRAADAPSTPRHRRRHDSARGGRQRGDVDDQFVPSRLSAQMGLAGHRESCGRSARPGTPPAPAVTRKTRQAPTGNMLRLAAKGSGDCRCHSGQGRQGSGPHRSPDHGE